MTTKPQPDTTAPSHQGVNYDELVISAAKAAFLVFAVKIVSVYGLAKIYGATLSLNLWRGFLPHLAFSTSEETFSSIVTWSTLAMATAALLLAAFTVARSANRERQRLWGRLVAGVVVLETLALQVFRQSSGGPAVQWQWSWLVVVTGVAGIILLAVPLWNDRAARSRTSSDSDSTPANQVNNRTESR